MTHKRPEPTGDLNLVPIMNLVTILIPFLLMAASFTAISVIDTTLPNIAPEPKPTKPVEGIEVSVSLTLDGYEARVGNSEVLEEEDTWVFLPCQSTPCDGDVDWDRPALTEWMGRVKDAHPNHETLILSADSGVPYGALVATMDAARVRGKDRFEVEGDDLFPLVVIAGGSR